MSNPSLAQAAQKGFKNAAVYDVHRPSYPKEAVDEFLDALEIKNVIGAKVIDLAAGTGKFTEILAARPEDYDVLAIEPQKEMRDVLEGKGLKNVVVRDGLAEDMAGVSSESVAAVTIAQAFHWVANMKTVKEVHRVLQPTGVMGMIWNVEDYNAPKGWDIHPGWETTLRDVVWSLDDNLPRFRHEKWRDVFDEQNAGNPATSDPLFGLPIGEGHIDHVAWLTKEGVWNRFHTLSQVAILEGEELEKVRKTFWDAIDSPDTEINDEGLVACHVKTYYAFASKIPNEPLRSGG